MRPDEPVRGFKGTKNSQSRICYNQGDASVGVLTEQPGEEIPGRRYSSDQSFGPELFADIVNNNRPRTSFSDQPVHRSLVWEQDSLHMVPS